jgi:proteic killer suppression protein
VILSFGDPGTAELFHGKPSRRARGLLPSRLHEAAQRKLEWLDAAASLEDLRTPPGNRLEALRGDWQGFWSIRINVQYRIVFRWDGNAHDVRVLDYH